MKHFVYFDGTSAWVGDSTDATDETEIIFSSKNFEECCDFEESFNNNITY